MSQNMDTKILLFLCNLKFLCYNSIVEKGGSIRIQHQQDKEYVAHASILEIHQKGLKIKLNTANLNFLIYNNCNKYWHLDVCLS